MRTSDYIADFLHEHGVECVFEMVGGMITYLLDSIHRQGRIKLISMHHEQAAAFAADAVGRMTGVPGVAMATSGPGATNFLTAIGDCYFDSVPTVFITGQVNTYELKNGAPIRQLGFQETDIVSLAKPITKAAWQAQVPEQVPRMLEDAFLAAMEDRPGPVLIDIPMDVQKNDLPQSALTRDVESWSIPISLDDDVIPNLLHSLKTASRPLILAGGGIRSGRAVELFRTFAHRVNVPVVNSLLAVDVLPCHDPLRVGLIGTYGNRWANAAIGKSDLLLVLGSRLDVRQTGADTQSFKGDRAIFHVDCDSWEISNRVEGCNGIVSELIPFFESALEIAGDRDFGDRSQWLSEINALKSAHPDTEEQSDLPGINPNVFMHALSKGSARAAAYSVDVGQHQMWAAQSVEIGASQRFLTSGGMGSMGFALPAGIGAAFASGGPVVVIAGDGGFQCNIQELQTIAHHNLPIKMVVMNNGSLGMVRQFQESYFGGRYQSTVLGYSAPDFAKVASAYEIDARTIDNPEAVPDAVKWLWERPGEPAVLQVMIDHSSHAYPKTAFGKPIMEMDPPRETR